MQFIDFCHVVTLLNDMIENECESGQWKFYFRKPKTFNSFNKTNFVQNT